MGIRNLDALADDRSDHVDTAAQNQEQTNEEAAQRSSQIAENDAKYVAADSKIFATRAEVAQKFADARDEIDSKYAKKVEAAEEQRIQQHSKNLEKREDAMGRVGLNPNGSDPQGRPQAVVEKNSRKVVEVSE